ncbi:MAG: hypothetical protein AB2689_28490 [Candidatus Thiodiazotropha taylori]
MELVTDRALFPNLRVVTVAGHSAGGQFVQRYAAGTQSPIRHRDHAFVYVVANPSSFMYLDRRRPEPGSTSEFFEPSTSCSFNDYKYGMDSMNVYMNSMGAESITAQYRNRYVVYLAGEEDKDDSDENLDSSCQAILQGPNRFARATAYANYIDLLYPSHFHQLMPESGVGHSSSQMFSSPEGRAVIFANTAEIPVATLAPPSPPRNLR